MEFMQQEEAVRAKFLQLLRNRALYVPDAENMSIYQLQQIYNGFIVPHPQRERREQNNNNLAGEMPSETVYEFPMEKEQLMQCITVLCVAGVKRSSDVEMDMLLDRAPKRCRIDQQPLSR